MQQNIRCMIPEKSVKDVYTIMSLAVLIYIETTFQITEVFPKCCEGHESKHLH